uniref:Putative oxidoreductase family protein n=1 Tax=viral metagenome TaxID=1070528 RepID=A0A6M3LCR2_9ZZZZ
MKFALIGDGAVAKYHRKAIEHVGGELDDFNIIDPKYMKYSGLGNENLLYSKDGMTYTDFPAFLTQQTLRESFYGDQILSKWWVTDDRFDYIVICSPSNMHRSQIKEILNICQKTQIICEKPAFLPWEPIVDSDQINICLQLQYAKDLPQKADKIIVQAVRDEAYFKSWKGDPKKTGGIFYNIFIHYIYMAHKLGADFEGRIVTEGVQERKVLSNYVHEELENVGSPDNPRRFELEAQCIDYNTPIGANRYCERTNSYHIDLYDESGIDYGYWKNSVDLMKIDNQACYNYMYEDIISGGGIKPRDLFYLDWLLRRNSELFGYGRNIIGKTIEIGHELL